MLVLIKGSLHFLAGGAAQSQERVPSMQGTAGKNWGWERGDQGWKKPKTAPWLLPRFWGRPLSRRYSEKGPDDGRDHQ